MSVLSLFALWLCLLQATPADATVYDNTRVLAADCPKVRVTTVAFLKKIGAHVEPVNGRPDTVSFSTSIKNAQGKGIGKRDAIHTYMVEGKPSNYGVEFPWHISGDSPRLNGVFHLGQKPMGCLTNLIHEYRWRETLLWVFIPVDGGVAGRPSNNRLESEYLDEIARLLTSPTK